MKNKILLFLSLVILGLLGNIYNIEMFFGVNQIFGSIFVLIAVWFFGPYLGLLCAILVHSYTIYLWGHPYAFIGFILEAFVVGVLLRWRISNLFVADLLYWLLLGIWLVPLFYGELMGLPETQVQLIMLKQPANGILNALLASIITLLIVKSPITIPRHNKLINLKSLLFTIIMTLVSFALYASANMISHNILERFQNTTVDILEKKSQHILYEQKIMIEHYVKEIHQTIENKNLSQQSVMDLHVEHELQALWRQDLLQEALVQQPLSQQTLLQKPLLQTGKELILLAIQNEQRQKITKPPKSIQCPDSPSLVIMNNNIYLTLKYLDHCYIAFFEKDKLLQILVNHADLTGLEILIFSQNKLFTSSLKSELADKMVKTYRSGKKKPITDKIYHLLPPGNMPKMVRWTKSNFVYDLPKQTSVSYQLVILFPFSDHIDSLQKIYIFIFSVMMLVIFISAIISFLMSKFLLKSFADLSKITKDIPAKLQQNETIQWPTSNILEIRLLTQNFTNVSDNLRHMFQDIEHKQTKLQKEISIRTAKEKELALATKAADKANQAKSEFLASMSHELRTPLNAVLGFSQLFMLDKSLSTQQTANANQIYDSGHYLLSLVNDLLDLSNIEAGRISLHLEWIDLNHLLDECYQIANPMAEKENVKLHYRNQMPKSPQIQADYVRLKQVLLNLLSNAIKYHGSEQPQVWLSYSNKGDDIEISVKDNGPGIAKDKQHNIFESFNRVGAENSYIEGSGIGLFISMKLLDMMQASIAIESDLGAGCHFKLTLALKEKSDEN